MIKSFFMRWLRVGDRWQNLHGFFQMSGAKFFIAWFALTPAVSKIIKDFPNPLILANGENPISIPLELPFSWVLLWFASFFYALGFVWFHLRCPAFIKKHPSYKVYQTFGHSPRWLVSEAQMAWSELPKKLKEKFVQRLIEKEFAKEISEPQNLPAKSISMPLKVSKNATEWDFKHLDKWYKLQVGESAAPSFVNDLFWEVFARHAENRSYNRYFIWLMSTLACGCTAWVVFQNIVSVFRYFLT